MDQEKEDTQSRVEAQDDILLAALKLFAEKGYFNTSLADIAEAAGIKSTSGLYHHFKNKQMIASALYANIFDSLSVSVDDIRRKQQKPSEQLRGVVDLLFRLADEAPYVMRLLLVLNINEVLPDEKPLLEMPPFIKILKIFQLGAKHGEIRNMPPQLCFAYFFGVINHTLQLVLTGDLDKKAEYYLSQTWLAAWNTVAKK